MPRILPDTESTRYPAGRFTRPAGPLLPEELERLLREIETLPAELRWEVEGAAAEDLDTPYREGGWTVRQVVHHLCDSHLNAYIRMKLAVTEDSPVVKEYDEVAWARLPDAHAGDVGISLDLLEALHRRWVLFLRRLPDGHFQRAYVHPTVGRMALDEAVANYAWHGRHHLAHVRQALGRRS